jgi:transposase
MLFGQKRERFIQDATQLPLPFEPGPEQEIQQEEILTEKVTYTRNKQKKQHPGRAKLPDHLPVEEVEIHPDGDLSQMVCIGKEITDELECIPEQFYIKRYIRYKYAPKSKEGSHLIAPLPTRVIDKGIPGAGLLAMLLVNKYVDHLPLYRQKQRFARENIPINASTMNNWVKQAIEKLEILYDCLLADIKGRGYLQADETPIKVLESEKKGACHQGYYWVYHDPIEKNVLFNYQASRSHEASLHVLRGFQGYLQSDGYGVYEKVATQQGIIHLGCMVHARRGFEKALNNDPVRAQKALIFIQQLYAIERQAKEDQLTPEQRKEIRLEKALPILNQMGKWLSEEIKQLLPKSTIGKAFKYCISRWDELNNYLLDGYLEIDNNLTENAIRPVALGRKNYLFAGSHEAAQRAAVIYTFFAICKKHQVNPFEWLKFTLENIMDTSIKNLRDLYPQNFKKANS